jgi:hypothetical protein
LDADDDLDVEISDVRTFEVTNYPLTLTVGSRARLSLKITCDASFTARDVARLGQSLSALLVKVST